MSASKKAESSDSSIKKSAESPASKKAEAKKEAPAPLVAGVSDAFKGPTTADLNPAFTTPDS